MEWIILGIIGVIALIIAGALMIPIHVIIKGDNKSSVVVKVRALFFTISSDKEKKPSKKKQTSKSNKPLDNSFAEFIMDGGLLSAVSDIMRITKNMLIELKNLFGHIKVHRFKINLTCSGEDAAEAAINYGRCCAVIYPVTGFLCNILGISKKVNKVAVFCDYNADSLAFDCHIDISIRIVRMVIAGFKIGFKELKHRFMDSMADNTNNS